MLKKTSFRVLLWSAVFLTICFFRLTTSDVQKITRRVPSMQQSLEIRLKSASIDNINPKFIGKDSFLRVTRMTRDGPPVMNGLFTVLNDWPLDANGTFTLYRKMSNKWTESFIKGVEPLCEMLRSNIGIYRSMYEYTSFPRQCPVRKGNVTFNKYVPKMGKMPYIAGLAANQEWKIKAGYMQRADLPILVFSFVVRLEPKTDGHHTAP